ncbi:MAG TPA: nucleoside-triphosphatase [Sphaerochaeta sp.]|nr:nucleoside-triphosphatase [Sphaerochaeta sp.]
MPSKTITLITGEYDRGKTTFLLALLREKNYPPDQLCGFVSLANAEKTCYRLKDLFSGRERVVLSEHYMPQGRKRGRFFVDDAVFAWANEQIIERLHLARLSVFDEVGRFELEGRGFDPSFKKALARADMDVVATVRFPYLQEVIDHYALGSYNLVVRKV